MGQLRGFSLDGFLEDYEQGELAFPWALPSESGPGEEQQVLPGANPTVKRSKLHASLEGRSVDAVVIAALEGLLVTAKVLYVADYEVKAVTDAIVGQLQRRLTERCPAVAWEVRPSVGPFTDDDGAPAQVEGNKSKLGPARLLLEVKKDLLTSVVALARNAEVHRPDVLVGYGQEES